MDEKKVMHNAFAKGNRGRWIFPVELEPSVAKAMRDDGVQINPLVEGEFHRTDTMKTYAVHVQGDNKSWVLLSPLEPEIAQEMLNGGVGISYEIPTVKSEEVTDEEGVYFGRELKRGPEPKEIVNKKVKLVKKVEPEGRVEDESVHSETIVSNEQGDGSGESS